MTAEEIGTLLKNRFGEALVEVKSDTKDPWILVKAEMAVMILQCLRDEGSMKFDYLRSLGAVDYGTEFEIVYHLFSMKHRHDLVIKTRVPRDRPVIATAEGVWPAANWHEREAFDLMGIRFEGHSDLRRLLLPDDWEGHPLRKDYQERDHYRGVATTREYPTGMPELPTRPATEKQG